MCIYVKQTLKRCWNGMTQVYIKILNAIYFLFNSKQTHTLRQDIVQRRENIFVNKCNAKGFYFEEAELFL